MYRVKRKHNIFLLVCPRHPIQSSLNVSNANRKKNYAINAEPIIFKKQKPIMWPRNGFRLERKQNRLK